MKYKKNDKLILNNDIKTISKTFVKGEEVKIIYVDKILKCYDIENTNGEYITEVNEVDLC